MYFNLLVSLVFIGNIFTILSFKGLNLFYLFIIIMLPGFQGEIGIIIGFILHCLMTIFRHVPTTIRYIINTKINLRVLLLKFPQLSSENVLKA